MFGRALAAVDPRLLYGIPVVLLLTLAVALLPLWTWLIAAAALVLGAAVTCARARRCGALDLPEARPTAFH